ncbi:MAG: efflux RND transporter periplasmic adaptor subunit [Candidatus Fermentibacteraceae bacterium]
MGRSDLLTRSLFLMLFPVMSCGMPDTLQSRVVPVTVEVASAGGFTRTVMAPAWLESADEVLVEVPVPGRVTAVHVAEGDTVSRGDMLVSTTTDGVSSAGVSASLAAVSASEALDEYYRGNLERVGSLLETGAASPSSYEKALAEARTAASTLSSARAAHAGALDGFSRGTLSAPFSGIVTRVLARVGNPAAGPLVALSGLGALQCRVHLSQNSLPWIEPGLPAFFVTTHHPGALFRGTVSAAASSVDPISGLVPVTVQIPDSSGLLLPGMSGMVTIGLETLSEGVALPRNAFISDPGGSDRVILVRNGRAVVVEPVTGPESGFDRLVLSGVLPGDSVVLLGNRLVSQGDSVRVVTP